MLRNKGVADFMALLQGEAKKLKDHHKPTTCPACLLQISITFEGDRRLREASQVSCHDFWNACIAAITVQRSPNDINTLRLQLRRNVRVCRRQDLHGNPPRLVAQDLNDPVHMFIHSLYVLLGSCLMPVEGGHSALYNSRDPKKAFGNRGDLWPTLLSDLVPFGERQSAEAHVRWACQLFSPAPFMAMLPMLLGCRSVLFPSLLEPELRERILWYITQCLHADQGRDDYKWPDSVQSQCTRPSRLPWWMTLSSRCSLEITVSFMDMVFCGADSDPDDAVRFTLGFERALLPAVNTALEIHNTTGLRNSKAETTNLARMALLLFKRMDEPKSPQRDLHEVSRREMDRPTYMGIDITQSPHQLVHHALLKLYQKRTCSALSCGKSVHQASAGKSLPLCSGCKFTQYCSKECQRADWKHEAFPHKVICPILRLWTPGIQAGFELSGTRSAMDVLVASGEQNRTIFEAWAITRGLVSTHPLNAA
ncbi:hypothetical protein AURDEDRAFT_176110 [Auricularia subglabra TFB-10046 SS5]|uniref:MYND-type domain-containing protein n=1 Tax=Auricularia subglabra (strain TFB-10046 / SS5) TaxID=717982 RepID=J0WQN6_AURST|nr:hypothetical protein AURDEDRAFT_176110 [Auricularia subglabra TFB-10046 SS5]